MKHLGDITGINGAEIEPVWCVTFGAPCQDLSVAGARAGMKSDLMGDEENTRSGLFFHAIRLIKEMREHEKRSGRTAELIRPRYTVYENVTGAFSSNKGADFQAVLNETIRVVCPDAPDVPIPAEGWHYAGTLMGDGWSVAWRTHDAQHWGTPQRRRRISVVADYGGGTAPEILFDKCFGGKPGRTVQSFSESMSGHTQSCGSSGQGASENSPQGIGESGENDVDGEPPPQDLRCTGKRRGGRFPRQSQATTRTELQTTQPSLFDIGEQSSRVYINADKSATLSSGGAVLEPGYICYPSEEIAPCLDASYGNGAGFRGARANIYCRGEARYTPLGTERRQ